MKDYFRQLGIPDELMRVLNLERSFGTGEQSTLWIRTPEDSRVLQQLELSYPPTAPGAALPVYRLFAQEGGYITQSRGLTHAQRLLNTTQLRRFFETLNTEAGAQFRIDGPFNDYEPLTLYSSDGRDLPVFNAVRRHTQETQTFMLKALRFHPAPTALMSPAPHGYVQLLH